MITDKNMIHPICNEYDDDERETPPLLDFNGENDRFERTEI